VYVLYVLFTSHSIAMLIHRTRRLQMLCCVRGGKHNSAVPLRYPPQCLCYEYRVGTYVRC